MTRCAASTLHTSGTSPRVTHDLLTTTSGAASPSYGPSARPSLTGCDGAAPRRSSLHCTIGWCACGAGMSQGLRCLRATRSAAMWRTPRSYPPSATRNASASLPADPAPLHNEVDSSGRQRVLVEPWLDTWTPVSIDTWTQSSIDKSDTTPALSASTPRHTPTRRVRDLAVQKRHTVHRLINPLSPLGAGRGLRLYMVVFSVFPVNREGRHALLPCYHFITPVLSLARGLPAGTPVHEHVHKCPAPIAQARATTPSLTPRLAWVAC